MKAGRKALIVDDSVMLLRYAAQVLAARLPGLQVLTARRAGEGFLLADRQRPDLLLLDYGLPDLPGEEFCRRLADHPATAQLPVIALCSKGTDRHAVRSARPNVVNTLPKPFTPEELVAAVLATLETGSAIPPLPTTNLGHDGDQPTAPAPPSPVSPRHRARLALPPVTRRLPPPAGSTNRGAQDRPDTPRPPHVAFRGTTPGFSLHSCLRAAGEEGLTGILRVIDAAAKKASGTPTEIYFNAGALALVSTRDADAYVAITPDALPVTLPQDALRSSVAAQRKTGCPLFLSLGERGLLSGTEAAALAADFGQRLFGLLWTFPRLAFEFEETEHLPEFVRRLPTGDALTYAPAIPSSTLDGLAPEAMASVRRDNWLLGTLRRLQPATLPGLETERFDGVPAYTREGYETIRRLQLTELEAAFARQVNGRAALADIAGRLGLAPVAAFLLLFRFRSVELMDYWPATALAQARNGA